MYLPSSATVVTELALSDATIQRTVAPLWQSLWEQKTAGQFGAAICVGGGVLVVPEGTGIVSVIAFAQRVQCALSRILVPSQPPHLCNPQTQAMGHT